MTINGINFTERLENLRILLHKAIDRRAEKHQWQKVKEFPVLRLPKAPHFTEKIIYYPFWKRVSYAMRNGWFMRSLPFIPSSQDIHIHNAWKDVSKKKTSLKQ